MLEIIFDRLVRLMTTSLRNFTSDNVEVSLDRITSVRFGDYLNSIPLPAILGVFKAEEWENSGLITVNSSSDLFDHRCPARRPPRPDRDPRRRPSLHHDRNQPGQAHDRGRARRRRARLQAAVAGQAQHRPPGDQSALCRDLAAGERRHPGAAAHRHGRPRRPDGAVAALRHHRADPRRPVADVHGREIRPRPDLGRPSRHRNRAGGNRRRCRALRGATAVKADHEARSRRHADARAQDRRGGAGALRRRDADRRPHGPRRRPRRRARRQASAQTHHDARAVRNRPAAPATGWRHSDQRLGNDHRDPGHVSAGGDHRLLHAAQPPAQAAQVR